VPAGLLFELNPLLFDITTIQTGLFWAIRW